MMIIASFAIGALAGEWLKVKTGNSKDKVFVDAFVTASLTVCVGVNLIWEKTFKVANMLPAIVIAVAWAFI